MNLWCSTYFFENHLTLLPKFLKMSPLARTYFGIANNEKLASIYNSNQLKNFNFNFLNPFVTNESDWIDDFIAKTSLMHSCKKQGPVRDISELLISPNFKIADKLYLEVDKGVKAIEVLAAIKTLLKDCDERQTPSYSYDIVEANQNITALEMSLEAARLHGNGCTPTEIARKMNIEPATKASGNERSIGGIYASRYVRKCINVGDNAFLGRYVCEKKLVINSFL